MNLLAASSAEATLALLELGALVVLLSVLARVASRLGMTAVPLYLVAGLMFGNGGLAQITVSEEFVSLAAEIGVLLLLFTLGLEYTSEELRSGLRTGALAGVVDAGVNFTPGFVIGLVLGWEVPAALLLGGVTWISSSGVISKVLADLDRVGNRETPAVLNLLVIEDLAMAVYLPIVAAVVIDQSLGRTAATVAVALTAVGLALWLSARWGPRLSAVIAVGNNETFLLSVVGLMLIVSGLAQQLQVSSAVGAFVVGLALSGSAQERAASLIAPLRDMFAAVFFLSFSFQIDPAALPPIVVPAVVLAIVSSGGKLVSGWVAARASSPRGRVRAGTTLIARGEFSIIIAALGAPLADGAELGALAAGYVLLTAVVGPLAAKNADRLVPRRFLESSTPSPPQTIEFPAGPRAA